MNCTSSGKSNETMSISDVCCLCSYAEHVSCIALSVSQYRYVWICSSLMTTNKRESKEVVTHLS